MASAVLHAKIAYANCERLRRAICMIGPRLADIPGIGAVHRRVNTFDNFIEYMVHAESLRAVMLLNN